MTKDFVARFNFPERDVPTRVYVADNGFKTSFGVGDHPEDSPIVKDLVKILDSNDFGDADI